MAELFSSGFLPVYLLTVDAEVPLQREAISLLQNLMSIIDVLEP